MQPFRLSILICLRQEKVKIKKMKNIILTDIFLMWSLIHFDTLGPGHSGPGNWLSTHQKLLIRLS